MDFSGVPTRYTFFLNGKNTQKSPRFFCWWSRHEGAYLGQSRKHDTDCYRAAPPITRRGISLRASRTWRGCVEPGEIPRILGQRVPSGTRKNPRASGNLRRRWELGLRFGAPRSRSPSRTFGSFSSQHSYAVSAGALCAGANSTGITCRVSVAHKGREKSAVSQTRSRQSPALLVFFDAWKWAVVVAWLPRLWPPFGRCFLFWFVFSSRGRLPELLVDVLAASDCESCFVR